MHSKKMVLEACSVRYCFCGAKHTCEDEHPGFSEWVESVRHDGSLLFKSNNFYSNRKIYLES